MSVSSIKSGGGAASSQGGSSKAFFDKIEKRECNHLIPKDGKRCYCGVAKEVHKTHPGQPVPAGRQWKLSRSTIAMKTDAHGIIEFKGDPRHTLRADFVRLSFDTNPKLVMELFENIWKLKRPKMVISVMGGFDDIKVQEKVARAFKNGLLKAARTTGAWVITNGYMYCATRYVAQAVADARKQSAYKSKIICIGIAPFGLLRNADEFVERPVVSYHPRGSSMEVRPFATLNDQHSYFLLVDNGTRGRYGAEIYLRRRFEEYVSQQTMSQANKTIPVVSVVLGGGIGCMRAALDYLTNAPPIPVVVCDSSGPAADLLAHVNRHIMGDPVNPFDHIFVAQTKTMINAKFNWDLAKHEEDASKVLTILRTCSPYCLLITDFRISEDVQQDFDHSILTGLLTTQAKFNDQLTLTLAWKRADIAKTDVFMRGREWQAEHLEAAMMEALVNDRVDFVELLLQNGCLMDKFLTEERLKELYNTSRGPQSSVLAFVMRQVINRRPPYALMHVGRLVENMIGGSYRSPYLTKKIPGGKGECKKPVPYPRPFNDLLIWAVLKNRKDMAVCFWQRGEDSMVKALVGNKLYKECAEEFTDYDPEEEDVLKENAKEFEDLSVEILGQCYQTDDDKTYELLTYELKDWPGQTALGLAVGAGNVQFLAHGACQFLLDDLWHGGIRPSRATIQPWLVALFPFLLFTLDYKTKDELKRQAQKPIEGKNMDDEKKDKTNKKEKRKEKKNLRQKLTPWEKTKEFFTAPITTFWYWTYSYIIFLGIYLSDVLFRMESEPSWQEYVLQAYTATYGLEMLRRFLISEQRGFLPKVREFWSGYWKVAKLIATIALITSLSIRFDTKARPYSHILYALVCGFWFLRLLELIEINAVLGQYMTIIFKMLYDTVYVVAIMVISMLAFGIMRTALLEPKHANWDWNMLRNVTYKPYFMWYGEVYSNDINNCLREEFEECIPGTWMAAVAAGAYMMLTNIILLNLLIAMFNHIYVEASTVKVQVWKFRRYYHVMEYEQHPTLPPPFVIIYHVYAVFNYFFRCVRKLFKCKVPPADYALKLILNEDEVDKLLDFEEECMEDLAAQEKETLNNLPKERLRRMADRHDFMKIKIEDVDTTVYATKLILDEMHKRRKAADGGSIKEEPASLFHNIGSFWSNRSTTSRGKGRGGSRL